MSTIVNEILEEYLDLFFVELYEAERRKACPIFKLIDDWQSSKWMGHEKPESELKQEILKLLDDGADVHEPEFPLSDCNEGYTPILKASEAGAVEVVQALIEKGANIEDKLISGYTNATSLSLAVRYNRLELVKILVKNGANLESRCTMGDTPLHLACMNNRPEIAEILIKNGAELNSHPLCWGHRLSPLHLTIWSSASLEIIKLLIQHGADLEKQSALGETPLLYMLSLRTNLKWPKF